MEAWLQELDGDLRHAAAEWQGDLVSWSLPGEAVQAALNPHPAAGRGSPGSEADALIEAAIAAVRAFSLDFRHRFTEACRSHPSGMPLSRIVKTAAAAAVPSVQQAGMRAVVRAATAGCWRFWHRPEESQAQAQRMVAAEVARVLGMAGTRVGDGPRGAGGRPAGGGGAAPGERVVVI